MKKTMILLAVAALLTAMLAGAVAENATLTVQGAGVLYVDADRATVSIGVRLNGDQVTDVQSDVNERMASVVDKLKEMGIAEDSIYTNAISIYPNYDYSSSVEMIVGYVGYNSVFFTTDDVDNVGTYIDAAFEAGANNLDNVEFFASDTTDAGRQALTMAVENARMKAEILAEAAGMQLGRIVQISEGSSNEYDMPALYAKAEDAGSGTLVIASRQRVSAAANVVFELVPAE